MANPFQTSELLRGAANYPVVKGGAGSGPEDGHPFRGNQYENGEGGGGENAASKLGKNIEVVTSHIDGEPHHQATIKVDPIAHEALRYAARYGDWSKELLPSIGERSTLKLDINSIHAWRMQLSNREDRPLDDAMHEALVKVGKTMERLQQKLAVLDYTNIRGGDDPGVIKEIKDDYRRQPPIYNP